MLSNILNLFTSTQWAITPDAYDAMYAIVMNKETNFSWSTFHGVSEAESKMTDDGYNATGTMGNPIEGTRFSFRSGNVGILHVNGPIVPRAIRTPSSGESASLERFKSELQVMDADSDIKQIILSIDSPGGAVTGTSEFSSFLSSMQTPTTSYIYGSGNSAAFWIASSVNTKRVVAADTAMVGSIGTVIGIRDTSEAEEKRGIKNTEIVSRLSKNKRLSPSSDEGKEAILEILDDVTKIFIDTVASNRGVTADFVLDNMGQGKIFVAARALENKMIDEVNTLDALVSELNSKDKLNLQTMHMESSMTTLSMAEVKDKHPEAYAEIFNLGKATGIEAECTRLKDIDSLSAKDSSITTFVNKHKYDEGMTKANMALKIFDSREEVIAAAQTSINTNGSQLLDAIEGIGSDNESVDSNISTNDDVDTNTKSTVSSMVEGAKEAHFNTYATKLGE